MLRSAWSRSAQVDQRRLLQLLAEENQEQRPVARQRALGRGRRHPAGLARRGGSPSGRGPKPPGSRHPIDPPSQSGAIVGAIFRDLRPGRLLELAALPVELQRQHRPQPRATSFDAEQTARQGLLPARRHASLPRQAFPAHRQRQVGRPRMPQQRQAAVPSRAVVQVALRPARTYARLRLLPTQAPPSPRGAAIGPQEQVFAELPEIVDPEATISLGVGIAEPSQLRPRGARDKKLLRVRAGEAAGEPEAAHRTRGIRPQEVDRHHGSTRRVRRKQQGVGRNERGLLHPERPHRVGRHLGIARRRQRHPLEQVGGRLASRQVAGVDRVRRVVGDAGDAAQAPRPFQHLAQHRLGGVIRGFARDDEAARPARNSDGRERRPSPRVKAPDPP